MMETKTKMVQTMLILKTLGQVPVRIVKRASKPEMFQIANKSGKLKLELRGTENAIGDAYDTMYWRSYACLKSVVLYCLFCRFL